jgi:hypothetical protein
MRQSMLLAATEDQQCRGAEAGQCEGRGLGKVLYTKRADASDAQTAPRK